MRITEIADASEQLALWKLINTSVWTAIDTQAKQQAQQRAASQQQRKAKRPRSKSRGVSVPHVPMPKPLPKPEHLQKTTNPSTQPTQKSAYPHTQQAIASRHPSTKKANVASDTANPTSTLPTSQAIYSHPSTLQQPHASQASHTLVPQRSTALPLQKRLTAQNKRV